MLEMAQFVSLIESSATILKCLEPKVQRPNQHFEDDNRPLCPSSRYCVESLLSPIASPSTLLYRGCGNAMERAVLLCSLFLGMNVQAYIAFGSGQGQRAVWVVTLMPEQVTSVKVNQLITTANADLKKVREFWGSSTGPVQYHTVVDKSEQSNYAFYPKLASIEAKIKGTVSVHWDVTTGVPWLSPFQEGFPFSHLGTLFNHENIWWNFQASECLLRPAFSWNIKDPDEWYPIFSPRFLTKNGPPTPVYIDPSTICSPQFYPIDEEYEERWVHPHHLLI